MITYSELKKNSFLIAGPCVIESAELLMTVARELKRLEQKYAIPVVFKASYDKANRTSVSAFRGPGMAAGLRILAKVKKEFSLPLLTDFHEPQQAAPVAEVVDVLQIPAFLCRQTDLLIAAARTGKIVNIKKAQFLSGADMYYPAEKVRKAGNEQILLTERGNIYGYNNLVVDFRNIPDMKKFGYPVVMDCTHSVQRPGAAGGKTGGNREYAPLMAYSAKIWGANAYFMETHPDPDHALSDGPNQIRLEQLEGILDRLFL